LSILTISIRLFLNKIHLQVGNLFLLIIHVIYVAFVIIAIFEINGSKRINSSEKMMWTVGFIFFGSITG
ncbi:hypothetical protein, partial [Arcticibacter svalbardensis]|uniref:hypothetical protein n=1 Tax=Arcticibacter svalbardensis TaxID=1288027 RepID=UPI001F2A1923